MDLTMELLILKSGERYMHVKPEGGHLGGIEKASVYPMQKLPEVKQLIRDLSRQGFQDISIWKLILTEMPLEDET